MFRFGAPASRRPAPPARIEISVLDGKDDEVSIKRLGVGESLAGLLVDGVGETPFVGATLRLQDAGVQVEIPYLPKFTTDQFAHVDDWFRRRKPQENLLLRTGDGAVMLYGCRWVGHSQSSGSRIDSGQIAPQETLLYKRDGGLSEPLTIATCRSRLDGLNRWARMSAVESESRTDDEGRVQALGISVGSTEDVEWKQGDATLRIVLV